MINRLTKELAQVLSSPVVLCCSGGPDSIFLTHLVWSISPIKHHIVYFNHHLRRQETSKEIELIKSLNEKLKFHFHEISLNLTQKNHAHFREHRLSELIKFCEMTKIQSVLLAHHLNDDIETLWMQLLKGAQVNFRGIPKITRINGIELIHPLLQVPKSRILKYINQHQLSFCIDSSNAQLIYTRNKIRTALSSFSEMVESNQSQIGLTLSYLKQTEQNIRKLSLQLDNFKDEHGTWIDKYTLTSQLWPAIMLKCFLEQNNNEVVNKDALKKIQAGLYQSKKITIKLKKTTIQMDYKWILVQSNIDITHNAFRPLILNQLIETSNGFFCTTKLNRVGHSTVHELWVSGGQFKTLGFQVLADCPFRISSQKKILRSHEISPIEQQRIGVIQSNKELIWIPGTYVKPSKGSILITFYEKPLQNLSK
jgi:tRNA(Ile)-lysidine synthetase-like protein